MLPYPNIDPVLLHLGPLQVRWYGLMYVIGIIASYFLVKKQITTFGQKRLEKHFENINIVLILSLILGGRLGYVLFYNLPYYLKHPLEIPATWSGGMSFHGAAIGLFVGGYSFCKLKKLDFWSMADTYAVTAPIGLALGRIGNFINGELFGRPTALPWAMIFPGGGAVTRHPSQLYEALLEGIVLFVLLWSFRKKPWQETGQWGHGSLTALFLIGYGSMRFIIEFFREPDPQIGLFFSLISMGQILCAAMIVAGLLLWYWRSRTIRTSTG
ncbi:MAG: prolipoprotein diacylglyceryl transferase [Proteobacteria bacterium]|nr:MAG: prolipoprotein diacylglyceryl transferase [Pseudomonadota bacterium]PIE65261.1 MAG: prolipoprotein diacylglyceryl transferase [Desulfobacterales bacterium]